MSVQDDVVARPRVGARRQVGVQTLQDDGISSDESRVDAIRKRGAGHRRSGQNMSARAGRWGCKRARTLGFAQMSRA